MTKSRWRESIMCLGTSHIAPERDELLKKTKLEIDDKVAKIYKLIKNKNQRKKGGKLTKDSELLELICDFHKQYQWLFSLYENLRGEVKEKVHSLENKESSSSTSSSDSESESYYSVDDASGRSSPKHQLLQKVRDEFKHKHETSSTEFVDLRNKLNSMTEEKEAMHLECMTSLCKIEEYENIIKELRNEVELTESTKQKLVNECMQLKEKLVERDNELLSFSKSHQGPETKVPNRIKGLERQVSGLKLERKNLCSQKRELEEKAKAQSMDTKQVREENSGLRARILELEMTSKDKQDELSSLMSKLQENGRISDSRNQDLINQVNNLTLEVESLVNRNGETEEVVFRNKQLEEENLGLRMHISELEMTSKGKEKTISALLRKIEENENKSKSEIEDLMARADGLKLEVDTLRSQKQKLEEQMVVKSNEASTQVKGFVDQVNVLQQELQSLNRQKSESESTIEKVTQEISYLLLQMEHLNDKLETKTMDLQIVLEEKEGLERQVQDLELEVSSMCNQKSEFEEKVRVEKEEFHVRITQLEQSSSELENASSIQIMVFGVEIKNLQQELDSLHAEKTQLKFETEREKQELSEKLALMMKQNIELTSKISDQQTSLKGQEDLINKLSEEHKQSKSQYLTAEKKIEETAEEFRKIFEDTLCIISRRIRVAEQLHLETKDVYVKTKQKYEKENTDLMEIVETTEFSVKKMKEIIFTANETLFGLDAVALKFEECSGNFMNRISKSSCEVLFAKDWVKRKNNAIKHVQEDLDCLLVQLDAKEAEVLGLREKVWKLENKVRELEKMVKEKEEGMLGIGEEKREAIRQLCVWIDYHRSRSDYLKKILSEMTVVRRSQRTS